MVNGNPTFIYILSSILDKEKGQQQDYPHLHWYITPHWMPNNRKN